MQWTDTLDAELRALCNRCETYGDIARQISAIAGRFISRNAVLGRAHRLKLKNNLGHGARGKLPAEPRRNRTTPTPKPWQRKAPPRLPVEEIKLRCVELAPLHVDLLDLRDGLCRYPYGEGSPFTFCGHPAMADTPYCTPHFHLCRGVPKSEAA